MEVCTSIFVMIVCVLVIEETCSAYFCISLLLLLGKLRITLLLAPLLGFIHQFILEFHQPLTVAEADKLLTARELVKGKVLETALMSAREVSDAICEATGADGISCVGSKFVIWRFSEKCQAERNQTGRAKHKETPKSKADPVGKGVRARRQAARQAREQRNQYFREQAIEKSIEQSRERQQRKQK